MGAQKAKRVQSMGCTIREELGLVLLPRDNKRAWGTSFFRRDSPFLFDNIESHIEDVENEKGGESVVSAIVHLELPYFRGWMVESSKRRGGREREGDWVQHGGRREEMRTELSVIILYHGLSHSVRLSAGRRSQSIALSAKRLVTCDVSGPMGL
jgi:hypothetical protein